MNQKQLHIISLMCEAIREKKQVKFFYTNTDGKKKEWRVVEPYLVGIRKHNGNIFLTGWFIPSKEQVSAGQNQEQKQYLIDNIDKESLKVLNKTFDKIKVLQERLDNTPTIDVICKISFEEK